MRSAIHLDAAQTARAWTAILNLRSNVLLIDQNADYVLHELPTLPRISDECRCAIKEVWDSLSSCVYDVTKEVRNLEDKLGLHGEEEWADPDMANEDPRVTTGFITSWLSTEVQKIDALIRTLEASNQEPGVSLAAMLVLESACNVLHSLHRIREAVDEVHRLVPRAA